MDNIRLLKHIALTSLKYLLRKEGKNEGRNCKN